MGYSHAVQLGALTATLVGLMLVGKTAFAAPGVGVVAVATERAEVAVDELEQRMAEVIGTAAQVNVVDAARQAPTPAPPGFSQQLNTLDAQIASAWRAYLTAEVEVARDRLREAVDAALPLSMWPGGTVRLADAALRLGVVLEHLGELDAGHSYLRLAMTLSPSRAIDDTEFSPQVVATIEQVRGASVPKRRLTLSSELGPNVAMVSIDQGAALPLPAQVELFHGLHLVTVTGPSLIPSSQLVLVRDDSTTEVLRSAIDPVGVALLTNVQSGDSTEEVVATLAAISLRVDVSSVVLLASAIRQRGQAVLGQRCELVPQVLCTEVVELAGDAGDVTPMLRALWRELQAAPLRQLPMLTVDPRRVGDARAAPPRGGCRACRSPWLWAGVGAAVITGVVVGILLSDDSASLPSVVIDPTQF